MGPEWRQHGPGGCQDGPLDGNFLETSFLDTRCPDRPGSGHRVSRTSLGFSPSRPCPSRIFPVPAFPVPAFPVPDFPVPDCPVPALPRPGLPRPGFSRPGASPSLCFPVPLLAEERAARPRAKKRWGNSFREVAFLLPGRSV